MFQLEGMSVPLFIQFVLGILFGGLVYEGAMWCRRQSRSDQYGLLAAMLVMLGCTSVGFGVGSLPATPSTYTFMPASQGLDTKDKVDAYKAYLDYKLATAHSQEVPPEPNPWPAVFIAFGVGCEAVAVGFLVKICN